MDVRIAESARDLDAVRRLLRAFAASQRDRPPEELDPMTGGLLDAEAWEREVAGLPGGYAPPDGCLLLCQEAGLPLGCGAFRRLDEQACEVTRLFVSPVARKHGVGKALAEHLIDRARQAGYRAMCLETSTHQTGAITLWRSLGFEEVAAYDDVPASGKDRRVLLRLDL